MAPGPAPAWQAPQPTPSIGACSALKRFPDHREALALLVKLSRHVEPIMKKRSWTVPKLSEMLPSNPALLGLNINRGREIKIRLRPAHNERSFLDFNDLLGTMLHELTHIVRGPHDAQFNAILDSLHDEYDLLLASGFHGNEGFRLGGRGVPLFQARSAALAAAEQRLHHGRFPLTPRSTPGTNGSGVVGTGSSGHRLGGSNEMKELETLLRPGELFLLSAVEKRRMKLPEGGCRCLGGGDNSSSSSSSSVVEIDDADMLEIIRIVGAADPDEYSPDVRVIYEDTPAPGTHQASDDLQVISVNLGSRQRPSETGPGSIPFPVYVIDDDHDHDHGHDHNHDHDHDDPRSRSASGRTGRSTGHIRQWSCPQCTLDNSPYLALCEACGFEIAPSAVAALLDMGIS
ncbi:WLM domain-containing protein [Polychytrium aggregatum]|uniref:WLM domain-containing protein n=1 Tax=Polychytrium aggregatum TaxID=110093 RepID=UPI0022FF27EE|nr:WLM domain-containing protein [Polychytrium aggregatum]KAI9203876.1 WLM domain-containing protein [Polychytrium aggregatum]